MQMLVITAFLLHRWRKTWVLTSVFSRPTLTPCPTLRRKSPFVSNSFPSRTTSWLWRTGWVTISCCNALAVTCFSCPVVFLAAPSAGNLPTLATLASCSSAIQRISWTLDGPSWSPLMHFLDRECWKPWNRSEKNDHLAECVMFLWHTFRFQCCRYTVLATLVAFPATCIYFNMERRWGKCRLNFHIVAKPK